MTVVNPAPAAPASDGVATARLIEHHAVVARRERMLRGSVGIVLAGSQVGLGAYGLSSASRSGVPMRRLATGQTVAGSIGIVSSIVLLARRSPLEELTQNGNYATLVQNPSDSAALQRVRLQWAEEARRARKRRLIFGGLNIAAGAAVTTIASIRLFPRADENSGAENLWAYTTLTTGVGLMLSGIVAVVVLDETERSYAADAARRGEPSRPGQRRRKTKIQVAPTLGGMSLSGSF